MKIEEVIKQLESILDHACRMAASPDADEIWKEDSDALEFAISALRSTSQPGKPLTLDQLREMDGQPTWCEELEKLVSVSDAGKWKEKWKDIPFALFEENSARFEWNIEGRELSLYSYLPAHIDVKVFCGNWEGEADGYADGELVYDVWRCGDCGHVEETDDPDLLPRFCPRCGRAMTPEAWTELERRLRG